MAESDAPSLDNIRRGGRMSARDTQSRTFDLETGTITPQLHLSTFGLTEHRKNSGHILTFSWSHICVKDSKNDTYDVK
jgi:hypothetical protein